MNTKWSLGLSMIPMVLVSNVSARVLGDVNGDDKVDLVESIYSLQVASGQNPEAATVCTEPDEVLSANRCWKDRNLGASQVATSSTDTLAYGDLYQWGRLGDGHQNRTSTQTAVNSANDVPGHSNYITEDDDPWSWRIPPNRNLWQGLSGVNNPCPQGFRLPTDTEWEAERASWVSNDAAGAFASPLKLVVAGYRSRAGNLLSVGSSGSYWSSSTTDDSRSRNFYFDSTVAGFTSNRHAYGMSIRCIKD
jgi:Fibrobacter succinogenes major domain (Fib_succ_major)